MHNRKYKKSLYPYVYAVYIGTLQTSVSRACVITRDYLYVRNLYNLT